MAKHKKVLSVFVASPSDVSKERDCLEKVIKNLNDTWSNQLGVHIELRRWETHTYPTISEDAQQAINEQIKDDYDIFLGIMGVRYGTPTNRAESGTEEELHRALTRYRKSPGSVNIMFYFKDNPTAPSKVEPVQLQKVKELQKSLQEDGIYYWSFTTCEEFKDLTTKHLSNHIQEYINNEDTEPNSEKNTYDHFTLRNDFLESIQHIEFVSQYKNNLCIDDLFVFPQLSLESYEETEQELIEKFSFFTDNADNNCYFIVGDELSGKSVIAKKLFLHLFQHNYLPILVDGVYIHKTKQFNYHFQKVFSCEYIGDFQAWKQKENKVVIIDDFNHRISSNINKYLEDNFDLIILIMNTDEFFTYFREDSRYADFGVVMIEKFSLSKQEELIRNWINIGQDRKHSLVDREIDVIEDKLNNIITKNQIVPRYAFYILSILQTLESFMPNDYRITAYGHCYQSLITARLLRKNIKQDEIDSCFNFLTELANYIFINKENFCSYSDFKTIYKQKYIVSEGTLNKLENNEYPLLKIEENSVSFEHPYIYYFFLGRFFAEHANSCDISKICTNIHLKENAFTVIFIVHHAQNQEILEEILINCLCTLDDVPSAKLSKSETDFMEGLLKELPKTILSEKSTEENRKEIRNLKENSNKERESEENADSLELKKSFKIIEVLGQIVKNRYGSFPRTKVKEILVETQELGLRVLNSFLEQMRSEELKNWIAQRLENEEAKETVELTREEKLEFIEKCIQFFAFILTFGMINKISDSIGSDKILRILQEIAEEKSNPAYELINMQIKTKHNDINPTEVKKLKSKYEKEKNKLAIHTLSYYIQSYMNTHKIDYQTRQSLCTLFNLDLKQNLNQLRNQ